MPICRACGEDTVNQQPYTNWRSCRITRVKDMVPPAKSLNFKLTNNRRYWGWGWGDGGGWGDGAGWGGGGGGGRRSRRCPSRSTCRGWSGGAGGGRGAGGSGGRWTGKTASTGQ